MTLKVGEKFEDWLTEARLLLVTTLQTATLCVGTFFIFEGTLQEDKFDMSMSPVQRTVRVGESVYIGVGLVLYCGG